MDQRWVGRNTQNDKICCKRLNKKSEHFQSHGELSYGSNQLRDDYVQNKNT